MCDDYPVYYYAYYTICDFYKTAANMIVSTFNKKYSLLENQGSLLVPKMEFFVKLIFEV